jgi:hypothetical protein
MPNYSITVPLDATSTPGTNEGVDTFEFESVEPGIVLITGFGSYHTDSMVVAVTTWDSEFNLARGDEWEPVQFDMVNSLKYGKSFHKAVKLKTYIEGHCFIALVHKRLGGSGAVDSYQASDALYYYTQPKPINWSQLDHPQEFQPTPGHQFDVADVYGMEYITDQIDRVRGAVQTSDSGAAQATIGNYLENKKTEIGTVMGTEPMDAADAIGSISLASDDSVKQLVDKTAVLNTAIATLNANLGALTALVTDYWRDQYGAKKSFVLRQLLKQQGLYNLSVFPVPRHLPGLVSWVDFSAQAVTVGSAVRTVSIQDAAVPSRTWVGGGLQVKRSNSLQRSVCVLSGTQKLQITAGPGVSLTRAHTVVVITCNDTTGNVPERLTLLGNGSTESIGMDISAGHQLKCTSAYGGWSIPSVRNDNRSSHMVMASVDTRDQASHSACSAVSAYLPLGQGFSTGSGALSQAVDYGQIGGVNQIGAIAEIIVYNRLLSKYELDALNAYCLYKYGIDYNLIPNGGFSEGMTGFDSDYVPAVMANSAGKICVLRSMQIQLDRSIFTSFYALPNYQLIVRQMRDDNTFLMVNTSPTATKAFYRRQLNLSAGVTYRLSLSVMYNPAAAPRLQLKVNGVEAGVPLSLDLTHARTDTAQWWFTAPADVVTIELFNLMTSGSLNTFAIDNISLNRDSQVLSSTYTSLNPSE